MFHHCRSLPAVTVVQMSIPFLLVPLDSAPYFRVYLLGVLTFATVHTGLKGTVFPYYIGTAGIEPAWWLFPWFFCQDRSSTESRQPCSKVSYYPRPAHAGGSPISYAPRCPSFRAATVYLFVLCRATLHCHYVALPLVTEMGGTRMN